MKDLYNREIKYMRVSLTELCNLRCRYCMPENGISKRHHDDMMTQEEIIKTIRVASRLGISKIRLTGGEPLVKKNILDIVSKIKEIDGIEEICLTTNGVLLGKYAKDLKDAGLDRINISLDTLNKEKFKYITRIGNLDDTLKSIDAALNLNFKRIKINTVLIGGFNDDEVYDIASLTKNNDLDVRFIELMPMYDSGDFGENAFIPCEKVVEIMQNELKEKFNNVTLDKINSEKSSVAKLYKVSGWKGHIGLISPVHNHFCSECNRIRLTADGKLKPCLHSNVEINVKGLDENSIEQKIIEAIKLKPQSHDVLSYTSRSNANRNMNEIGG